MLNSKVYQLSTLFWITWLKSKSRFRLQISTLKILCPYTSLEYSVEFLLLYIGSYYLSYIQQCVCVNLNLLFYPPIIPSLVAMSLFSTYVTLFQFCK